jgi:hypothetical protein
MSTAPAKAASKTAAKSPKQPSAKAIAYKQKRAAKLAELKTANPTKFAIVVSEKEAKEMGVATDWASFCQLKAKAYSDFWTAAANKPKGGVKSLERKKARMEKLKAMLQSLEKELGS